MFVFHFIKIGDKMIKKINKEYIINNKKIEVLVDVEFDDDNKEVYNEALDQKTLEEVSRIYQEKYGLTGNEIKEFRKSKKLTQQELSDILSINRKTLIAYEKNHMVPSEKIVKLIKNMINDNYFYKKLSTNSHYVLEEQNYSKIYNNRLIELILSLCSKELTLTSIINRIFLIDLEHYKNNNKPLNEISYIKLPVGIYSEDIRKTVFDLVDKKQLKNINNNLYKTEIVVKYNDVDLDMADGEIETRINNNDYFNTFNEYDLICFNVQK